MIKIIILITTSLLFSGCVNKHGISAKRYSDCKEYYDFQSYYHKDCGEDDMLTYKEIGDGTKKVVDTVVNTVTFEDKKLKSKPKPKPNVW